MNVDVRGGRYALIRERENSSCYYISAVLYERDTLIFIHHEIAYRNFLTDSVITILARALLLTYTSHLRLLHFKLLHVFPSISV